MEGAQKKTAIISVCSLLLVAMVIALVLVSEEEHKEPTDVSGSQKAITAICQTTDYQDTCLMGLHGQNSTDPKDLIKVAFQASINFIKEAIKNSTTLRDVSNDPRAKDALDSCEEVANNSISDLQRSFDKFTSFDITKVDDVLMDLKIWLSGAMTQQETCLDGFAEIQGDSGEKMKNILTTSMQMTSNALAMVAEISTFLESMGIQSTQNSRRLLSEEGVHVIGHDEFPEWLDFDRRELIAAQPTKIKPFAVVARDGSGNFRTINEALKVIPKNSNKTTVLYIKGGTYDEIIRINSTMKHLMMIGDGPTKTIITGNLNYADGVGTYHTATVAVQGDDFIAREIGFENKAGPSKHQAVALRVSADKAVFYNCQMDGYQDTLYAHAYRQFYRDCVISGTIDFIFGDSAAVFQGCTLLFRKPLINQQNIVTAQGRKDLRQPTGLVIQNCTFMAHPELQPVKNEFKSYLGRPWKEYSRTIIMESFLDDLIHADGWLPWTGNFALETLFYTEFNNRGPASPKAKRVKWGGVKELPSHRIQRFTAAEFLDGNRWIPPTRVPYAASFIFPVPKEDPNIKYSPVVPEENKDLGLNTEINKEAFAALKPNITIPPPASPSPPPPIATTSEPVSNIAAAPTSNNADGSALAPSPLGSVVVMDPVQAAAEVIIDLSPSSLPVIPPELLAPAPTPISPTANLTASPSLSPTGAASPSQSPGAPTPQSVPSVSPSQSPTGSTPQSNPSVSPSQSPSSSSPQPNSAASPSQSPSGSTPQSDPSASPSTSPSGPTPPAAPPSQSPSSSTPQSGAAPSGGSTPPPQPATNTSPTSPTDAAASPPTQPSNPVAAAPSETAAA